MEPSRKRKLRIIAWGVFAVGLLGAQPLLIARAPVVNVESFTSIQIEKNAFSALMPVHSLSSDKVRLGRILFFDKRLSSDQTISCASCHSFSKGGADGLRFSPGVGGVIGDANAPTVYNSSLNFRQFWDGRALTLEAQVDGPVTNPKEMAARWPDVIARLSADREMISMFQIAYGSQPSPETVADAIATFEKTLVTLDSPFDLYLGGDRAALGPSQVRGMKKFETLGCVSCHQGANLGGNMFQTFGIAGDYFKDRGGSFPSDAGRFNVTKKESDRNVFRVPSLRNVELTAPYFHDGSAATLKEAVRTMAKYQLGRSLNEEDTEDLVAFLNSLTGKIPETAKEVGGK